MEVDFAWPERGVVVELDSWEYHGTRAAFERDQQGTASWSRPGGGLRVTWRDLDEPGALERELRAVGR